ncbi:hypothetical protein L6164_013290 [Bauhinia variegata]|uniref:Uncharacterized protein n=1 Tax=Bauhinia variegata TaxID=167791 RepID=A0ACB9PCZ5_BAUVA|nr:hypothetical protein L6164_013290 [Bauhinia variegata]
MIARGTSPITPKARATFASDHEVDRVGVTYPSGYAYYDNLSLEDAPSTSNLSSAWWISKEVIKTDSLLNVEGLWFIKDTLFVCLVHTFDVEAYPLRFGICEASTPPFQAPNPSIELVNVDIASPSLVPSSEPMPLDAADLPPSTQSSFGATPTKMPPASLNYPLEGVGVDDSAVPKANLPFGGAAAPFVVNNLVAPIEKSDAPSKAGDPSVGQLGVLPLLEGFSPLNPTTLVVKFQHVHLDDGLRATKDVTEERASVGKEKVTAANQKAIAVEEGLLQLKNTFSQDELAAATSYLKVGWDKVSSNPNDEDNPDLSFPISDVDGGSDGEGNM